MLGGDEERPQPEEPVGGHETAGDQLAEVREVVLQTDFSPRLGVEFGALWAEPDLDVAIDPLTGAFGTTFTEASTGAELGFSGTIVEFDAATYQIVEETVVTNVITLNRTGNVSGVSEVQVDFSATVRGAPTVAFGELDVLSREFEAARVYAGSSVSGAELDAIHGNVVAREGNALSVKGAILIPLQGRA